MRRIGNRLKSPYADVVAILERNQWKQTLLHEAFDGIFSEQDLGTWFRFRLTVASIDVKRQLLKLCHGARAHLPCRLGERLGEKEPDGKRRIAPEVVFVGGSLGEFLEIE
jgi:hypothetical protein